MGPVWVAVSVHAEAHHPRARAELRLVLSSMCENALGGAVQAKHPLLTFVFLNGLLLGNPQMWRQTKKLLSQS